MTDEKKYEPAGYRTSGLGPGKTALASEIQKIGRGLRKYQEQAIIDAVFPTGASQVIEHEHKLVPQMGTITGRFDARDPQETNPPRLPLTVGLGGGKTRALMIANAKDYIAQTRHGRDVMIALAQDRKDAEAIPGNPLPDIMIWDECHYPKITGVDWGSADYVVDFKTIEDRIMMYGMGGVPRANPTKYLSYEELRRLSRQRIPTSGVNQSIYLRSFEPAAPAIVGKPTKHRAKAMAGRKAKRKNRK